MKGHKIEVWFSTKAYDELSLLLPEPDQLTVEPDDYLGEVIGWLTQGILASNEPACMEQVGRALHNVDGWDDYE